MTAKKLTIPELALVVLIGASGSGKSTFAKKHFRSTEILSSDYCRGLVSDDETDQSVSQDAFDVLHYIAAKRLAAGRLTVIDATNLQAEDRKYYIQLARQYHCLPVAIILDVPERLCHDRNQQRPDRQFGPHVVQRQIYNLRRTLGGRGSRSLRGLDKEGFRHSYILSSVEEINEAIIERQPLWNNRKQDHGPFDIIGDIHGCCDELEDLLHRLGYARSLLQDNTDPYFWSFPTYQHPEGRKVIFLGDLVDRGPRILDTLKLVHNMVKAETALCVPGNHDIKLLRKLKGKKVTVNHGLEQTLQEIGSLSEDMADSAQQEMIAFLDALVSHYILDHGKLVVAHAGMKEELQGRGSARVREFALYGETTGEIDEFGLPVRYNWAADYRGKAMVIYGHTPVPQPEWLNNTLNIDTGCVFGGKLTALRYPEKDILSVTAKRIYCEPVKPLEKGSNSSQPNGSEITQSEFGSLPLTAQQAYDDVLDIKDVVGKRILSTRLKPQIIIREENSIAALEVMSRFAVNPKWLIYLPPTMSPVQTSQEPGWLEYPTEALAYYDREGIPSVICEEKHMGSRTVVILGQSEAAIQRRFGIRNEGTGICYTRTGRRFFENFSLEQDLLQHLNRILSECHFWERFQTDWVCLDAELMPWSVKAQSLLRQQYAPVGTAAHQALTQTVSYLGQAAARGVETQSLIDHYQERVSLVHRYREAYQRYCWSVASVSDLKLAPFHILATEGSVHTDKSHDWHMKEIEQWCGSNPIIYPTQYRVVDLSDPSQRESVIQWWKDLTHQGGEGMVVKPLSFISHTNKGLIQPAVKCRGQDYLRIIYGPEYSLPHHLERLRQRGLSLKRSLALREFALGIEALERFVAYQPLRRIHECVFAILALESEPVDPRL